MHYRIEHETSKYIRLRTKRGRFTQEEAEILQYALSHLRGVTKIRLHPASGGITLSYRGGADVRAMILQKISALQFQNVERFARNLADTIDQEELARRKLSPQVKSRLRRKVLLEAAADLLLPMPVQLGYHAYQLVTLRDL